VQDKWLNLHPICGISRLIGVIESPCFVQLSQNLVLWRIDDFILIQIEKIFEILVSQDLAVQQLTLSILR